MFIIVLGRHVSVLIKSSSGPSKNTDPYLATFKMRCGIPNAYILDKTMYEMHVSLCSYYTIRIVIYGPWVDSTSNRNEYQEHFLGVKAAGA